MQHLYILRGLPGSGKSTYAREYIRSTPDPEDWIRVNKDDLRAMMHDNVFSREREKFTHESCIKLVSMALSIGKNVLVDNTHITNDTIKPYHRLAESLGNITVTEEWVRTPLEECLERNASREGNARVPDEAIMRMAAKICLPQDKFYRTREDSVITYPKKTVVECRPQDESLPKAIICDLDGTLAHMNGRNPYDASTCEDDILNNAVEQCLYGMATLGHRIIFMSGRDDKYREQTMAFLRKNDILDWCRPELHMRATGDNRKDSIVKRELYEAHVLGKYNVRFVLDDRDQVVELWRSLGLVCFQVAPGAF
jgi:predicted kinase